MDRFSRHSQLQWRVHLDRGVQSNRHSELRADHHQLSKWTVLLGIGRKLFHLLHPFHTQLREHHIDENITLTLSVSGASLETGANPDSCSVYYSLDSTINFELPALASFDADYTQFPVTSYIVTLPSAADDNSGIGIKLAVESNGNGNKFDYCYFSDVTLRGDLILTSPPTAPTTANPTTANPTTAMPSVSPTTADPSSSPTTANPTATYNPTT